MATKKNKIWLRQPNEPQREYNLFEKYLMLGVGRSLEQLAKAQGRKKVPEIYITYYQNYNWEERASAYDEHILEERGKKRAFTSDKIHEELTSVAQRFLDKVNERLSTLDANSLSPRDVKEWVDAIVKVQKLSSEMGISTGKSGKNKAYSGPLVEVIVSQQDENDKKQSKAAVKPQIIAVNGGLEEEITEEMAENSEDGDEN